MDHYLNPHLSDADKVVALQLTDRLMGDRFIEISIQDLVSGPPAWFSRLVGDLVLAVADDDLLAVFPQMDPQRQRVRVVVLTRTRIIDAYTGTTAGDERHMRVVSRSAVRDVNVTSAIGVFTSGRSEWPGAFTVTVTVDGLAAPVTLPLPTNVSFSAPPVDMRSVLNGLLADLARN